MTTHPQNAAHTSSRKPLPANFFEDAFRGYAPQPAIRTFAEAFCTRFEIRGICDPAYTANTAALDLQIGDGRSNFFSDRTPNLENINNVGTRLSFSYSTCIANTHPGTTPEMITDMLRRALSGASIEELIQA